MWSMILKDLTFHKKNFILSVLMEIIVVVYTLTNKVNDALQVSELFMAVPLIVIMMFTYIMCVEEEKYGVLNYLKSLPIKKNHIVLSKYLWCCMCVFLAYGILFICVFIIDRSILYMIVEQHILLSFVIYLLWISIFLALYYRLGCSYAHYSLFIIPIFYGLFKFIKDVLLLDTTLIVDMFNQKNNFIYLVLLLLGIIIMTCSYKFSAKSYISRCY